jgi:isopentenyl phosphate kinase
VTATTPTVVKLGGSVITRKEDPETVDDRRLEAVCETIAASRPSETGDEDGDLVLVHGAGSFGHHHADRHGVSRTAGTRDAAAIGDIHGAMTSLSAAVVGALQDAGVPAVPVRPFSAAARDEAGELSYAATPVRRMLGEGLVPVLHGDVVVHAGEGATILSGDELVVTLARALDAERVGLCSGVPGVFDEDGGVRGRIDAFDEVAAALGGSDATDVTGGMAEKVRALLALEAPAAVFGVDDLGAFLAGEDPGTTIGYQR